MDILNVDNVTKNYARHRALDAVSLSVPEGTVYGLLGPNGAGKTTLIRIINHITAPDEGVVTFDGHRLTQADVAQIGYLPEERGLYKKMKVGDQAIFFARLKGMSSREARVQLRAWFEKFGILDWWDKKVEELSKGMAQKVQFIVTVLHRPKLLIFDEPFSGFDPINAALLRDEILELKRQGSTVIFSTHNMASVEEICDNITLINQGRNILTGNVAELRERFSKGKYQITFRGASEPLAQALAGMTKSYSLLDAGSGAVTMNLDAMDDATVRDILGRANDTVEILAFEKSRASMNDIFIQTITNAD